MYKISFDINIDKYSLRTVESVNIIKSVDNLTDTAEIIVPVTVQKQALEIENKIKRGDKVVIKLGYNDLPTTEFVGYVHKINNENGTLIISCEDEIYLFRTDIDNQELNKTNLKNLLKIVVDTVNKAQNTNIKIECKYDFVYDKFLIENVTCYDILAKIAEETRANIYIKDKTLYVVPVYLETFGDATYDFSKNIDREGVELTYKTADERNVFIRLEYTDSNGQKKYLEKGKKGGDTVNISLPISNLDSLNEALENEYNKLVYEGYEGSFQGWLIPYCDAGFTITIIDSENGYRQGKYYVLSVETSFSENGGIRTITIGKKL